jgi:tetratricopeptide (TPR) repeat protein
VLTAPLLNENPTYRDRYYADVGKYIQQVSLKASPRRLVEPVPYFERAQRLAGARKDIIVKDYQDGLGFDGIAKSVLGEDLGRSVDAVADVWSTILTRSVMHASVSDGQVRDYAVGALEFYIRRGSEPEIDANYRRLSELTPKTPDMAKRIGDMFYDGGFYERAIKEYEEVLAAEPRRKDVTEKIAAYYVKVGDEALAARRLQQARDAYAKAVQTDPLHPTAESKRLQTETLIAERDARLEAARGNIDEAARLQTQSEQFVLQRKFADAMGVLKQAQADYEAVPDEFPTELQAANAGLANIASRLSELKAELIQNAQTLSGTNFLFDIRQVAATGSGNLDEQALRTLMTHQLDAEIAKLKAESQDSLRIQ